MERMKKGKRGSENKRLKLGDSSGNVWRDSSKI